MRPEFPPSPLTRAATRLRLLGSVVAAVLVAAACGGDDISRVAAAATDVSVSPIAEEEAAAAHVEALSGTRSGAGILMAGGDLHAIKGSNPCEQTVGAQEPIKVAYVGADLAELEAVGLETIIIEEPSLIISAYVNEVNFNGGIHGRCVEFVPHLWSLADPAGSLTDVCAALHSQEPVLYMTLRITDPVLQCATVAARIPAIGLYAFTAASTLDHTGDRLYLDDGTVEHLLSASVEVALATQVISTNDPVGLLHGSGGSEGMAMTESSAILDSHGLNLVATADVPSELGDLALLLAEKQVRLLEDGLSDEEAAEAQKSREALPREMADMFTRMEQFYLDVAAEFKAAGVAAVTATAEWSDLRRLIRAAELIDWHPIWIANDIQPATLVLSDVPRSQALNLVLVSSRRAAGDTIPELDRGCVTLRNASSGAAPFAHRLHTDAWTLITAVCDYLDVAFSALTRAMGDINADSFVRALQRTLYETEHGGLITFSRHDFSGAEFFRVLEADPDCVLNHWGCMRSASVWIPVVSKDRP